MINININCTINLATKLTLLCHSTREWKCLGCAYSVSKVDLKFSLANEASSGHLNV